MDIEALRDIHDWKLTEQDDPLFFEFTGMLKNRQYVKRRKLCGLSAFHFLINQYFPKSLSDNDITVLGVGRDLCASSGFCSGSCSYLERELDSCVDDPAKDCILFSFSLKTLTRFFRASA